MSTPIHKNDNDLNYLADHVRSLISATADVTEEHVKEARALLVTALDGAKSLTTRFRDQATAHTRACDLSVHQNPYQAIGVAMALGALLSYFAIRECPNKNN
jgi:ElaB/YqjD/DUF883 family membrane-anchored ribosome-binding protein